MQNRSLYGPAVIGVATIAALVAYGLIRWLWVEPIAEQNGKDEPVTALMVAVVTIAVGILAWVVAAALRRAGKATWWPFVGSAALAISIIGPSYLADGASAVALIVLHLVVAVVLMWGFAKMILGDRWWERSR